MKITLPNIGSATNIVRLPVGRAQTLTRNVIRAGSDPTAMLSFPFLPWFYLSIR